MKIKKKKFLSLK
jgi:hypothetical protein